jgi:hypothetical protein
MFVLREVTFATKPPPQAHILCGNLGHEHVANGGCVFDGLFTLWVSDLVACLV